MPADRETIEVWADWSTLARVGHLHAVTTRGKQVFSFEYDPAWLQHAPPI